MNPEHMTHGEMLKVARKWARKKGGVLKPAGCKINGRAAYMVVDKMGSVTFDNWTLYSICCDEIYA